MPYEIVKQGEQECVKKKDTGETVKCHNSHEEAVNHLQALQANVKDSAIAEFTMAITKARYDAHEVNPNRRMQWRSVNSDVGDDLYEESMSTELFYDFVHRIRDNVPVPEEFEEVICEGEWCGGMPYLSVAHYRAGTGGMNIPGDVDSIWVEGDKLKSRGFCRDSPMGHAVYEALKEDLVQKRSGNSDHKPVRISIGFLDLQHKHVAKEGGQEFVFTRSQVGEICPLCSQGVGGKIYTKGQLIHLGLTRVPVNPRTEMVAEGMEEKSMNEITTKKQDAESIIGKLADELEEKSLASDILVIKSEEGSHPVPDTSELTTCYDPNTGGWDNECIANVMEKYMPSIRDSIGVAAKSEVLPKELVESVVSYLYKSNGIDTPVVEDAMSAVEVKSVKEDEKEVKESPAEEAKEEEKKEMKSATALDKSFETLKALIAAGKEGKPDVEAINKAFSEIGTNVENEFSPVEKSAPAGSVDMVALKSLLEEVVAPLRVEIATLKAQVGRGDTVSNGMVKSKALSLNFAGKSPEELIQRSGQPQAPTRKLTQIEMIARKSTGASV